MRDARDRRARGLVLSNKGCSEAEADATCEQEECCSIHYDNYRNYRLVLQGWQIRGTIAVCVPCFRTVERDERTCPKSPPRTRLAEYRHSSNQAIQCRWTLSTRRRYGISLVHKRA